MFYNIILIILLILMFFFLSNEQKINDIMSKKYIKYLLFLLIIYFIYQNYNFAILVVGILILILLNVDIKSKFVNNKYLQNIEGFKTIINEYFSETYSNKKMEKFTNDGFDVNPYQVKKKEEEEPTKSDSSIEKYSTEDTDKINNIEPFKEQVMNLKNLYENIKMEITKLN